jgi:hypothetical protein
MIYCAKAHSTSQLQTLVEINLHNSCPNTVEITVPDVTTYVEDPALFHQSLSPNETINIRSCIYLNEAPESIITECVPDNYTLQISAGTNSKILNKTQLLEMLGNSNYKKYTATGFWIWRSNTKYKWTIADPALCP